MRPRKIALLLCSVLLVAFLFSGCGTPKLQGEMVGKWYYIYDTEKVGMNIKENGTAVLDGEKYECSFDSDRIYLKDKKGYTQGYRYSVEGQGQIYLYKPAIYRYQGAETQNGLVGVWVDTENGRSNFEFTAEGTFREDSYIPGYYSVDEENGTIKLVYNDQYYDTTIYYTIKDDCLMVEYPWPMVKGK